MTLYTNDLILRTVTGSDIKEIARTWRYPKEITKAEAYSALEKMISRHKKNRVKAIFHICLAVFRKEKPEEIIGWCGWDGQSSTDHIALFYMINEEHRCKGYATQCAVELLRYAFEDMEYDIVYSGCARDNVPSFKVMTNAGMCHNEVYDDGGLGFYMDRTQYLQKGL